MLTATYTLVALSVEQASVRASLQSFQRYVYAHNLGQLALTDSQLDYVCSSAQRLYDTTHWRKIDTFLIPAIRNAAGEAGGLLRQLDTLNRAAAALLDLLLQSWRERPLDGELQVARLCDTLESFCSTLLKRLELEEHALFPLARSVITGEAWFSIANRMLVHDALRQENKSAKVSAPDALPVRAAPAVSQPDLFPATELP
jgi:hemerythrin-like domain-containing protein